VSDRARRAIEECRLIATMTEEPGRTTRRFLTPPVHQVHQHLRSRMERLGMEVRVDAVGNLRGLWKPSDSTSNKRLILGSHIDTVPDAGAFDGVLGVVLALEWVQIARDLSLPLAIEVLAFSEEEGVRYGIPFLGSRAVAGSFDDKILQYQDADGVRMDEAIRAFGLDPKKIGEAVLSEEAFAFVEIHIEQGPVLEAEDLQVAVVEGIVGQSRLGFRFAGHANHAGTTPMHLRHDALAAAAEWIGVVESLVRKASIDEVPGLVATVGKIAIQPNAGNVIPGLVDVSLDLRHMSNRTRSWWCDRLIKEAENIASRRGITVEHVEKMNEPAVMMDNHVSLRLIQAVEDAGFPVKKMPSGAGHDAMIMAGRIPTAMLFLRSPGGLSHHPDEAVREEDVKAALRVGEKFLERLAADFR
jgi:allantoate deiminase